MLLALALLAAADVDAARPDAAFIAGATSCVQYIGNGGRSIAPFAANGFAEVGKSEVERAFRHVDGKVVVVLKKVDADKVSVCHVLMPAWKDDVQALAPPLVPLLGKVHDLGGLTMFDSAPRPFTAFLNTAHIQGHYFADLELKRVDKEKSDQ